MDNAKKMILIDPSVLEKLKQPSTVDTPLSRLDKEMQDILNSNTEDRQKCILYLQILQRYLNFTKEDRQPYRIPLIDNENQDLNEVRKYKTDDMDIKNADPSDTLVKKVSLRENIGKSYTSNQILSLIPKSYVKKGELLLNLVSSSNNKICWDETGTVIIDGEKIPESNIVDLVNDSLRALKHSEPIGWQRFASALKDIKVPLSYIGNPKRLDFMKKKNPSKDSQETTSTEEIFSTPASGNIHRKKIKRKIDWEKWTPY